MFWPDDNEYYPVIIQFANDDGRLNVDYDDGNSEFLDMSKKTCNLPQAGSANTKTNPAVIELSSSESDVLSDTTTHFGNKSFLKHQAQGFEQSPLLNAYRKEKETFSNWGVTSRFVGTSIKRKSNQNHASLEVAGNFEWLG